MIISNYAKYQIYVYFVVDCGGTEQEYENFLRFAKNHNPRRWGEIVLDMGRFFSKNSDSTWCLEYHHGCWNEPGEEDDYHDL